MKSSLRNFTSDLRSARAVAISRGHQVKLSFKTGTATHVYNYFEGDRAVGTVSTWTPVTGSGSKPPKAQREVDQIVYFPADSATTPETFIDEDATPVGHENPSAKIVALSKTPSPSVSSSSRMRPIGWSVGFSWLGL